MESKTNKLEAKAGNRGLMGKLHTIQQGSSVSSNKLISLIKSLAMLGIMRFYLQSGFQIIGRPTQVNVSLGNWSYIEGRTISYGNQSSKEEINGKSDSCSWAVDYLFLLYQVKSGEKLYSAGFPFFSVYLNLFILLFF